MVERWQGGFQRFAQKHRLRGANGRAGRLPAGDGPRAERSGSIGQGPGSRTRICGARLAGNRARSHAYSRCHAGAAQRLSSAKTTPRLVLSLFNSQLITIFHGQIHRTKNESEPALRGADFRFLQGTGAEKLPARHARPERFPAQTIGVRDCARRKTEAALSIWASRAAISEDFRKALKKRGVTGETLLQLLETRIDNVVYRLGLANTRSAARQLVSHGHVLVNGRSVNIASYNVKAGDEITIKDKPKSRQLVLRNLDLTQIVPVPDWLTADRDALSGKVARIPSREEMQPIVNEQLIVELYSR